MASILDLMGHVQQQGELGRQRGKESALGRLMAQGYQQGGDRSQLLGQIAQVDPRAAPDAQQAFAQDDEVRMQKVGNMAGLLVNAPPQARAGLYAGMVPELNRMGFGEGLPPQWDEALLPSVQGIYQQLGGGASGTNVQSTFVDAQGNRIAIMRDGSTQVLGQNAPSNQIIDTGNGFYGVNKGNLQAAPVMIGGAPQAQAGLQYATSDGQPIPEGEMPALQAAIAADARGESFNIPAGGGQQLRSVPKPQAEPDTFVPLTSDELAAMGLPPGTFAQKSLRTGKVEIGPASVQPNPKLQATARKERQMLAANDASIDQTVKLIDDILTNRDKFYGVTGMGSALSKAPGTPWADVSAKLDTLKGRSAFGALQQMRANSPTGGALGQVSERELYLLQNAETQLQNTQSPESLAQALQDYKAALLASKQRMNAGVAEFYSDLPAPRPQAPAAAGGWSIEVAE